jgi:orotate phosphoribosyltransferase
MDKKEARTILKKYGALKQGHFVLASWRHSSEYVDKDAVYPHTRATSSLGMLIAKSFKHDNIEVVVGPEMGGIKLADWVAHHLSILTDREILSVFAEKERIFEPNIDRLKGYYESGLFVLKRGYDELVRGKRVLVVDNQISTGAAAIATVEAVRHVGGAVRGVGCIARHQQITAKDISSVPKLVSLITVKTDYHQEGTCPLCAEKILINTEVGRGKEWLELHPNYPRA